MARATAILYDDGVTTRIVSTPGTCGGRPRIDGTRMTVRAVLSYMAGGDSIDDLLHYYPDLTRDDLLACLGFAADHVDPVVIGLAAE